MKVVYIAGKFRGADAWEIANNIHKAATLALEVWKAGMTAICPHLNTAVFQGALPDDVWLKGDLEILSRCDAVLVVDNWMHSEGARAEVAYAARRGIIVTKSLEGLVEYFKARKEAEGK